MPRNESSATPGVTSADGNENDLILTDLVQDRAVRAGDVIDATIIGRCAKTGRAERFAKRTVSGPVHARVKVICTFGLHQYRVEMIDPDPAAKPA